MAATEPPKLLLNELIRRVNLLQQRCIELSDELGTVIEEIQSHQKRTPAAIELPTRDGQQ